MAKSNKVIPKKTRVRPATGRDPVTAIRLSQDMRDAVDAWAVNQNDKLSRSEAIRRLIEIGLNSATNIQLDAGDLKATLSLLDAYAKKEKAGAHFKDKEQSLPDGYYAVRVQRLRDALAGIRKAKSK